MKGAPGLPMLPRSFSRRGVIMRRFVVAVVAAGLLAGALPLTAGATPMISAVPGTTTIVERVGCDHAGSCPYGFTRKCGPYGCGCKPCGYGPGPRYYKSTPTTNPIGAIPGPTRFSLTLQARKEEGLGLPPEHRLQLLDVGFRALLLQQSTCNSLLNPWRS